MTANASVQKKSNMNIGVRVGWTRFMERANPVFVTVFTTALLALFLMPFLYMIFTSLRIKLRSRYHRRADLSCEVSHLYLRRGEQVHLYTKG